MNMHTWPLPACPSSCTWRHPSTASDWEAAALSQLSSLLKYVGRGAEIVRIYSAQQRIRGFVKRKWKRNDFWLSSQKCIENTKSIRKWEFCIKAKGQVKHKTSTISNRDTYCQLSYIKKELMSDLDRQVWEICYAENVQIWGWYIFGLYKVS